MFLMSRPAAHVTTASAFVVFVLCGSGAGAQDGALRPHQDQLNTAAPVSFDISGRATTAVYVDVPFEAGEGPLLASVTSNNVNALFSVELLDEKGSVRRGAASIQTLQQILIPPRAQAGQRGYLRVTRQDTGPQTKVAVSLASPEQGVLERTFARGYSYREYLDPATYACWVSFAESVGVRTPRPSLRPIASASMAQPIPCEDAAGEAPVSDPKTDPYTARRRAYNSLLELIGRGECTGSACEPIVAFLGLGGANRILLMWNRDGRLQDPTRISLEAAKRFWAVFLEDDGVPYETSIDVEFRERASAAEYEEYNPATTEARVIGDMLVPAGTQAATPARRGIRVGFRRFDVRNAPIAINVAFTRQGAAYGLRQWQRVYRSFSGGWPTFAISVMVPARAVEVSQYQLTPVVPISGAAPTRAEIEHSTPNFQVFATVVISVDQWRSRAFGEGIARNLLRPDIQLGVGLPADRVRVLYAGGSWPLPLQPLRLTVGAMWQRQQELLQGVFAGQTVPLESDWTSYSTKSWKFGGLFGISVDLVRTR